MHSALEDKATIDRNVLGPEGCIPKHLDWLNHLKPFKYLAHI